jgi:GWxTD domain-containing protein
MRLAKRVLPLVPLVLLAGAAVPSRTERLAALPEEERAWLTEFVAPIILPDEEKLFLELTEQYQRDEFKQDFWQRREQPGLALPLGPGYRERYEELRRLADETYDGWREDAGRMVLRLGEPAAISKLEGCNDSVGGTPFRDLEVWTYQLQKSIGRSVTRYMFYRRAPLLPRKLWTIGVADSDVFAPGAVCRSFESLAGECSPRASGNCCSHACEVYQVYQEIRSRQGSQAGGTIEYASLSRPPEISTEGLERFRNKWASLADPKARPIPIAGAPAVTPTPEPKHRLSGEEMRDRILKLEPRYLQWLEVAGPLMAYDDLSTFLQLTPKEKDRYMREFLKKRA